MKNINFVNTIVRQGNSLCIRIPNIVIKTLKLSVKDKVKISINKVEENAIPLENLFKLAQNCRKLKELNRLSENKLFFYCFMLSRLAQVLKYNKKKARIIEKQFEKDFGKKTVEEFAFFTKALAKHSKLIAKTFSLQYKQFKETNLI